MDQRFHLGKTLWAPKVGYNIEGGVAQPSKTIYASHAKFGFLEEKVRQFAKYEAEKGHEYEHAMHHGQKPGDVTKSILQKKKAPHIIFFSSSSPGHSHLDPTDEQEISWLSWRFFLLL